MCQHLAQPSFYVFQWRKKSPTCLFNGTQGAKEGGVDPMKRVFFVPYLCSWIRWRLLIAGSFELIGLQEVLKHFIPSNIALVFTYSLWGPPFRDNLRSVRNTVDQARPVMSSLPAARQYSAGRKSTPSLLPHCCGQRGPRPTAVSMTMLHRRWKR